MSNKYKNIRWDQFDDLDDYYDEVLNEGQNKKIKSDGKFRDPDDHPRSKEKEKKFSSKVSSNVVKMGDTLIANNVLTAKTDNTTQPQSTKVISKTVQAPVLPVQNNSTSNGFVFGPNTREIKTVKIDFDRVVKIEMVEGEHKGFQTFGIKFYFAGTKGFYRIIWFGRNLFERDKEYVVSYKFWQSLQQR